ncbi:hypothetical protein Tco_1238293 [Tanacetum coccineum]
MDEKQAVIIVAGSGLLTCNQRISLPCVKQGFYKIHTYGCGKDNQECVLLRGWKEMIPSPTRGCRKRDCVERIPVFRNPFLSTTMGDENPIRTLGDYSKPSHEGYRNTIELPEGNNVCEIDRVAGGKLRNKNADESWEIIKNLALYDHEGPSPQPQALNTTFEAQRKEVNGRMTEMFGLLKELTTSRTLEKVLIREEAKFPVTKNLNSISLTKGDEREGNGTKSTSDCTKEPTKTETEMLVVETKEVNKVESKANASKTSKNEEAVEASGCQPVAYYLKHKINEKLIKGVVNNKQFNNSQSGARARKKKGKEYKILLGGPAYEAIPKKRIAKKEDVGEISKYLAP